MSVKSAEHIYLTIWRKVCWHVCAAEAEAVILTDCIPDDDEIEDAEEDHEPSPYAIAQWELEHEVEYIAIEMRALMHEGILDEITAYLTSVYGGQN